MGGRSMDTVARPRKSRTPAAPWIQPFPGRTLSSTRGSASPKGRLPSPGTAVPAGLTGALLKDQIEDLDRIWTIALMLIVFGLVLLVADRMPARKHLEEFRLRDALAMGVGQALALQPGVSRSGATLTVSRALGYSRDAAARLVFLMSLPIIAGAGVFSLADADIPSSFWPPFLWGMAASAATGWVAVWGTLKLVRTRTFAPFVAYRVVVGAAVLVVLALGWR